MYYLLFLGLKVVYLARTILQNRLRLEERRLLQVQPRQLGRQVAVLEDHGLVLFGGLAIEHRGVGGIVVRESLVSEFEPITLTRVAVACDDVAELVHLFYDAVV